MSLVLFIRGVIEGLTREAEGLEFGERRKLSLNSLMVFMFVGFIEDKFSKKKLAH
jgi:hypothetical protein